MTYIWIIVIILLAIVEALTTNLTTIWFVASGFITLLMSFLIDNYLIQIGLFFILGLILFITTRPVIKKMINERNKASNK